MRIPRDSVIETLIEALIKLIPTTLKLGKEIQSTNYFTLRVVLFYIA